MSAESRPPLEYLLGSTDSELRRFVMHALERAAILEKQKREILEELIAARVEAETAEIMLGTRRLAHNGAGMQQKLELAAD